jgi:hypothetical protein
MPLRRELPPFLFGGSVGRVFGLLLAPYRFQVIFFSQSKIRLCHSLKSRSTTLSVTGRSQHTTAMC